MAETLSGTVETVTGHKPLCELGKILTHEHLSCDLRKLYTAPPKDLQKHELENRARETIRLYPYNSKWNLHLNDDDARNSILASLKLFEKNGGKTIVENSSYGLVRDFDFLAALSEHTKINMIVGTGYYTAYMQSQETLNKSIEELYGVMYSDLEEGCLNYRKIKAGFIGEVGSTWPIKDFEKHSISATGEVQAQLHCPVSLHCDHNANAPWEVMRIYQEAGGNASKAILSHVNYSLYEEERLMEFVDDTKCYLQFIFHGTATSFYGDPLVKTITDWVYLNRILELKKERQLHRVLLSNDIHTKHRLESNGGFGYSYIIEYILPCLRNKRFTEEDIDLLLVENPKRWLA